LNQPIMSLHDFAEFAFCRVVFGKASRPKGAPERHSSRHRNE
jgi:hypothetical protein